MQVSDNDMQVSDNDVQVSDNDMQVSTPGPNDINPDAPDAANLRPTRRNRKKLTAPSHDTVSDAPDAANLHPTRRNRLTAPSLSPPQVKKRKSRSRRSTAAEISQQSVPIITQPTTEESSQQSVPIITQPTTAESSQQSLPIITQPTTIAHHFPALIGSTYIKAENVNIDNFLVMFLTNVPTFNFYIYTV